MKTMMTKTHKLTNSALHKHKPRQMRLHKTRWVALSLITGFIALPSSSLADEMQCKGLEQSICESETLCIWVESYTRKDERVTKAYCRKGYISKKSSSEDEASTANEVSNEAKKPQVFENENSTTELPSPSKE